MPGSRSGRGVEQGAPVSSFGDVFSKPLGSPKKKRSASASQTKSANSQHDKGKTLPNLKLKDAGAAGNEKVDNGRSSETIQNSSARQSRRLSRKDQEEEPMSLSDTERYYTRYDD
jgi:hypothetical protein